MNQTTWVYVWDRFVRWFHWLLVAAFFIAYFTEDEDLRDIHIWSGYAVLALVVARIIWGFVGTQYALFSDFVYSPRIVITYLKDILARHARRYLGHNPVGGMMVILLLVSLLATTISGIAVYGADEHAGPMASLFSGVSEDMEDVLEEIHEFFANFTLFLIVIHIIGVIYECNLHRENLILAMFSGRKRGNTS